MGSWFLKHKFMLPIIDEFLMLYASYGVMVLCIVVGLLFSRKKNYFKWNAIIFLSYFFLMIYIFSDSENFKYGGSLVVLFYGGIFVAVHFFVMSVISVINFFKKFKIK